MVNCDNNLNMSDKTHSFITKKKWQTDMRHQQDRKNNQLTLAEQSRIVCGMLLYT